MLTTELDLEFRTMLTNIWLECQHIVNTKMDNEIGKLDLKKLADTFFSTFENTQIPVKKIPVLYADYNSVAIMFADGTSLPLPYFFYQQAQLYSPPDYLEVLSKDIGWYDLLSKIFEEANSSIIKLNQVDIGILRALTFYKRNPLFKTLDEDNKRFLFQINTLANLVRSSEKWVSKRLNYLIQNFVIFPKYIVNPFLFGLETYSIFCEKSFDSKMSDIDAFSLIKLRLSNHVLRVIQIPFDQRDNYINFNFPHNVHRLSQMNIFNNLSDLRPNNAFTNVPKFESAKAPLSHPVIVMNDSREDWIQIVKTLGDSDKSDFYPVLTKISVEKRLSIIIKIINYLAKWGMPQGKIKLVSKSLGTTVSIFMETCRFLFNYDIIAFFPRITRIGCSFRYGVYIETEDMTLLEAVYENLLELPHSVSFFGEGILVAYVALPKNYSEKFLLYLIEIAERDDVFLEYGRFISLKSWGRFNIQIPKGTTIDEYGINYPLKQTSQKSHS